MGASLYCGKSQTLKLLGVLFPGNGQLEKRQGVLCREFLIRNHLLPFKTALCEMLYALVSAGIELIFLPVAAVFWI